MTIDGFAFDVEVLWLANRCGFRIVEVPIDWSHIDGSKVSVVRDSLLTLKDLLVMAARHRWRGKRSDQTRHEQRG